MRLAILSDVHADLPALEAVLSDMGPVDGLLVAGDLTGGPQPNETVRLLRQQGAWLIRGNSDNGPVRYHAGTAPRAWYERQQFALLRWTCRHLDAETLAGLQTLPEQRAVHLPGTAPIRVVHGSPWNPSQHLLPDDDPATLRHFGHSGLILELYGTPATAAAAWAAIEETVLVCGHSHIAWVKDAAGRLALNPGAVCGPLDGYVGAQYAILEWVGGRWQVEPRAVSVDMGQVRAAFERSGLLAEGGPLAAAFLKSTETGRNVAEHFLAHARAIAAPAGLLDDDGILDPAWEQAAATFDWRRYDAVAERP